MVPARAQPKPARPPAPGRHLYICMNECATGVMRIVKGSPPALSRGKGGCVGGREGGGSVRLHPALPTPPAAGWARVTIKTIETWEMLSQRGFRRHTVTVREAWSGELLQCRLFHQVFFRFKFSVFEGIVCELIFSLARLCASACVINLRVWGDFQ